MTGTIVNMAAVAVGGCAGLLMGKRLPQRFTDIFFQCMGLVTLALGVNMILESANLMIAVASIVLGAVAGELLNIERGLDRLAGRLRSVMRFRSERFNEGFVTATILYCVGSMAILGAIEDGTGHFPRLLFTKSIMDGMTSVILCAALGAGAIFSILPLALYQGSLTLFAGAIQRYLPEPLMNEMTAVGGLMMLGIGVNLLQLRKVSVANMLPALLFAPAIAYFFL
ncbi:MAG: DUF554 domain-containing protein [Rikenellaceae bacterium]|jgi:uncharacterized membrane protein YqgA involved in biofilm formation|nr:DUF554 domain-containing protein [Rikenellaceae bacterium]